MLLSPDERTTLLYIPSPEMSPKSGAMPTVMAQETAMHHLILLHLVSSLSTLNVLKASTPRRTL